MSLFHKFIPFNFYALHVAVVPLIFPRNTNLELFFTVEHRSYNRVFKISSTIFIPPHPKTFSLNAKRR